MTPKLDIFLEKNKKYNIFYKMGGISEKLKLICFFSPLTLILHCLKKKSFQMKILFVGDASNMHNCLAQALRNLGHIAVVASNGSHWMDTARDIDLSRGPGKMEAVKYILGVGELLTGWLLTYDALKMQFRKVKLPSDTHNCAVCGDNPTITELIDYEQAECDGVGL